MFTSLILFYVKNYRIKELFEATGGACDDGKYRAIVEWYSRPRDLEKFCKDVEMDPENEVC